MPNTNTFDRLITAAFCALAITAAAACSGKAESEDSASTNTPKHTLPSAIGKTDKTMTTTTPPPTRQQPAATAPAPEPPAVTTKPAEPDAKDLFTAGRRLIKHRAYGEAIDKLEQVLSVEPKHSRAQIELARAYIKLGKARTARPHAEKGVELRPKSSYAWNTLGRVELLEDKLDAAAASFERAIKANEHNLYAFNNLGLTYIKAKKFDKAVEALVKATADKRAKAYMWNNLGTAYEQLGKRDEARTAYKKAADMGSGSAKRSLKRLDKAADGDASDSDDSSDIE